MQPEVQEGIAEETAEANVEAAVSFAELFRKRMSKGDNNEQEKS